MKKLLILLFSLLFFSVSTLAEPKQLVCTSDANVEADRLAGFAEIYADPNSDFYNLELAEESNLKVELCRQATFGWKLIYTFDTLGLTEIKKDNAEFSKFGCNGYVAEVREAQLSATPNVITFLSSGAIPERFNVNRKTLKGDFWDVQCEVRDVDTSDNLI